MNRGTNDAVRQAAASAIDAQVRRAKVCEECGQLEGLGPHFLGCSEAGHIIPTPSRSAIASTPSGALPRPGTGGVDGVAGRPVPPPGSSGDSTNETPPRVSDTPGRRSARRNGPRRSIGMKRRIIVGTLLSAALLVGGCSGYNDKRGKGDAPVGSSDDSPTQVINFPDGFANVATKCDGHGHRVYVNTREGAVTVIADAGCGS